MSGHGTPSIFGAASDAPQRPRRSRLRRFFLRHLPLSVAAAVVLLAIALVGGYICASSAAFENLVRERLISQIETAFGGRVEIASFHWRLLALNADADGLVIHGLEAPGEAPYASVEHLHVRLNLLNLLSPTIRLRDLDIIRPSLHFIVYPDGTTNQPHPRMPNKSSGALDTFFRLKARSISVEQGWIDYDNRAAAFDFQNRWVPLDLHASDVSLRISYLRPASGNPATYRIETGVTGLSLVRGGAQSRTPAVRGRFEATLDLERNAILLHSLRLTAQSRGNRDRTLTITGSLQDFSQPRWQGKAVGDLDMALLDPVTGYPYAPQGIAHLDLNGEGQNGLFRIDGAVHIDDGAYIGTGVNATGVRLDARVHADAEQLHITSIVAHLRQGGELDGEVALNHWLPPIPGATVLQRAPLPGNRAATAKSRTLAHQSVAIPLHPPPASIPVNGKVTAEFKGVTLDAILDIVSKPPFQRLGLDARLNGPATGAWTNGDARTLAVSATLNLAPSGQAAAGEAPTSGVVDGTYTQRDGAVALRNLELHMPGSEVAAHGTLGAYPLTSPSSLAVDFSSSNLSEFDTLLRSLGVKRDGKTGSAALPVKLAGEASFHGTWTGSLARPHVAGNLQAAQLAVELPAAAREPASQPQFLHLDSVAVTGSYAPSRIVISQGVFKSGTAKLSLNGSLDAAAGGLPGPPVTGLHRSAAEPVFDGNSELILHLEADKVDVTNMQPFFSGKLPLTGTLDARIQLEGPLHAPGGSGWLELDGGSVYGQTVARLRAQGTMANQQVKLASISAGTAGGSITGAGSYDFQSRRFQVEARGTAIDIAGIGWIHAKAPSAAGKLGISVSGSGTFDDPRLEGHGTLSALTLGGERLGELDLVAHTIGHTLHYDVTSRLEVAEIGLHGQTELDGEYPTQAQLDFSRLDIGPLLRLAHVYAFTGTSALAGTVTVEGPLAQPDRLRGEAQLKEMAVTVAGVNLQSPGGAHATLADGRIHLDTLHVTGEDTDLHAGGSLALEGDRHLDLAASGSFNLKLAQTLDPDLTASGLTTFQVEAHGPLKNPGLQGRIDFQNGSLSLEDLPNGLSQLHGTLVFNQNRLEVRTLTAMSGGGLLTVGGFLGYQHGIYADLSVSGKGIRIRYPPGISSLADASLHLEGAQTNLLLSGDVFITRFTASPDLDITALALQANAVPAITPPDAPSNHIRLDVYIHSAPQLSFQNAFAKLAGDVDLHLRGTVATPSLLGQVTITEGNALIAGTQYELQRGQISFTNPVRIDPIIDLNATARVEDYDITLGLHGSPEKLAVTYRSDPPMPEADVVALLALGHTTSQERLYTQQQVQSLSNPTTDALLGGALNATMSSRVQKLFGASSVKVDPNYLGAFGNSTSRITVEEQVGRNLTLTYATNVNTTGQQLLQADVAINRHVSLVIARDESGVFSMVIKATRRFR
jgi:translocation and assembly module TamB